MKATLLVLILAAFLILASLLFIAPRVSAFSPTLVGHDFAKNSTGVSDSTIRLYLPHGSSVKLAVLVGNVNAIHCPGTGTEAEILNATSQLTMTKAGCTEGNGVGQQVLEIFYYIGTIPSDYTIFRYHWSVANFMQIMVSLWIQVDTGVAPTFVPGGYQDCGTNATLDPAFSPLSNEAVVAGVVVTGCSTPIFPVGVLNGQALDGFGACSGVSQLCMATAYTFAGSQIVFDTASTAQKTWSTLGLRFSGFSPPTVTTEPATQVDGFSAVLWANVSDMKTYAAFILGFEYSLSPSFTSPLNVTYGSVSGVGNYSVFISSLSLNTTYYFRAWITTTNGFLFLSGLNFTTLQSDLFSQSLSSLVLVFLFFAVLATAVILSWMFVGWKHGRGHGRTR